MILVVEEIYSMILVVEVTYIEGKDSWDGISDSVGVWKFDFPNTCFFIFPLPTSIEEYPFTIEVGREYV
jgi:hypothetical protein